MRTLSFERGHIDLGVAGQDAVADAGQEIGDGIGHRHGATYQLDLMTPGMSPRSASVAEAEPAQLELAEERARAAALLAAVAVTHLELLGGFGERPYRRSLPWR